MRRTSKRYTKKIALFFYYLCFFILAILLFEHVGPGVIIKVSPRVYGEYDPDVGAAYVPNTSISFSYLNEDGVVVECLQEISKSNRDGFRGEDTINDYKNASIKVVVSGDSFSHWNNNGKTVVDITKSLLQNTSLINLAGGAFGLKHMFASVSEFVDQDVELMPDLVIIQFIKDDITRDWWVTDSFRDQSGLVRSRIAKSKECLDPDSDCGADQYVVHPKADYSWCASRKGIQDADDISNEITESYSSILGRASKTRNMANRILRKLSVPTFGQESEIPRIHSIDDFDFDSMLSPIKEMQNSDVDVMLVFLPTQEEITNKHFNLSALEREILGEIEGYLGTDIEVPISFEGFDNLDGYVISPYDGHPSVALQNAYAEYVAELIRKNFLRKQP